MNHEYLSQIRDGIVRKSCLQEKTYSCYNFIFKFISPSCRNICRIKEITFFYIASKYLSTQFNMFLIISLLLLDIMPPLCQCEINYICDCIMFDESILPILSISQHYKKSKNITSSTVCYYIYQKLTCHEFRLMFDTKLDFFSILSKYLTKPYFRPYNHPEYIKIIYLDIKSPRFLLRFLVKFYKLSKHIIYHSLFEIKHLEIQNSLSIAFSSLDTIIMVEKMIEKSMCKKLSNQEQKIILLLLRADPFIYQNLRYELKQIASIGEYNHIIAKNIISRFIRKSQFEKVMEILSTPKVLQTQIFIYIYFTKFIIKKNIQVDLISQFTRLFLSLNPKEVENYIKQFSILCLHLIKNEDSLLKGFLPELKMILLEHTSIEHCNQLSKILMKSSRKY